ncbi:MAG: YicC family protein [Bacteroidia bacterium]|nr:MAG: YicC family protein [Bacteroidia bacterium]
MIRSMTGYGKAECLLPDKKLTIEIRSLNSKQMDTNTRLPSLYKEKELEIRQLITSGLERGKVECSLYYELSENAASGIINEEVVKSYYQQLYKIAGELGLPTSPELLSTVMRMPDTIRTEKAEIKDEEWLLLKDALLRALDQVQEFRNQEGLSLDKDMRQRVKAIAEKLGQVAKYEAARMEQIRERIGNNLGEFLKKDAVDENRFEQELIYYIEKLDISEEKVRLANHCNYFLETMEDAGPAGKKLGFISQEMGREINTLGSKANHTEIQKLVVEMKDELERIKEQVLNVL